MTLMRKCTFVVLTMAAFIQTATAQQDPMFTNYMFNSLTFNPAYAGSRDHLTVNLLHRTQWWGIDGGPVTQTLSMHTPLKNDRVGVGFSMVNDKIGPTNSLSGNFSYAYRVPIGKTRLSIALQGGFNNWRADWSKLSYVNPEDPAYQESPNLWNPNFGAGVYWYSKYWAFGAGVPRIVEYDLRKPDDANLPIYAREYRHYFFSGSGAIPINGQNLIFKPSLLVKNVGLDSKLRKDVAFQKIGAPTEFNIDLSLFFYETLWVGASFRSAIEAFNDKSSFDSADLWAAWYLDNGLRIGAAYDYTLTKLQQASGGSFEIMLGYEFDYKLKKTATPRYF